MKEKNSSTLLLALLVALMVFMLASCGSPADEAVILEEESEVADTDTTDEDTEVEVEEEPVTIEWMQWFGGSSREGALEELVAAFEAEHPNIHVELVNLPFGEVRNQVITNAAAGQLPDVIGMNPPWMAEFVNLGVLEPLDERISGESILDVGNLVEAPMEEYQGHTWMLPYTASTFLLFYNKDLFEQAGLSEPPSNWDELREYAAQLTDEANDEYGFTMFMNEQPPANGSIVIMYPLIYAAGGRTVVDGQPMIESEAVLQTLQLLDDLHDAGSVAPGTISKVEVQMVEEFSNGHIGMMIENTGHIGTLAQRSPDMNYGLVPIPSVQGEEDPDLRHHGWALGMSAESEHKDAAWTFMSWLVSPEASSMIAEASSNIPGNLAADVSFYDDRPQIRSAIDIMARYNLVEELMMMPKSTAHWQAFTIETIKMLNDDQTPEEAMANTQEAWAALDE